MHRWFLLRRGPSDFFYNKCINNYIKVVGWWSTPNKSSGFESLIPCITFDTIFLK